VVIGVRPERPEEAEGVERRRPERVDEVANVRDGGLGALDEVGQQLLCTFGMGGNEVPCGLCGHRQAGELWPEPVVQVAPEAPPLLLASRDQPLARALKVGGEPQGLVGEAHRMDGHADLVREVLKELPVRRSERLVSSARPQDQATNRLAPVDERQSLWILCRLARGRHGLERGVSLEFDGHVWQLKCFFDRLHDGR
jgi:hypothetical protein